MSTDKTSMNPEEQTAAEDSSESRPAEAGTGFMGDALNPQEGAKELDRADTEEQTAPDAETAAPANWRDALYQTWEAEGVDLKTPSDQNDERIRELRDRSLDESWVANGGTFRQRDD